MPVVGIPLTYLRRFLGETRTAGELIDIFHEIGISVDGVETAQRFACASCGEITETVLPAVAERCDNCRRDFLREGTDFRKFPPADMFRLELLANRPDNFDAAGIARSVKGYLGMEEGLVAYAAGESGYEVTVDPRLAQPGSYRPCIACAVVKNLTFDDDTIRSVMKLQENLHWALGRNRKFGAIGLYDLRTIGKKIFYRAVADDEIAFVPLACGGAATDSALSPRQILATHPKGKGFAHLLEGFDRFPLLIDEQGTVLSMPPIINSERTRVTKATSDVFIDVTGLSADIVEKTLTIVATSLKEAVPECEMQTVAIRYADRAAVTPGLRSELFRLDFNRCRELLGNNLPNDKIVECLRRMRFDAVDNGDYCEAAVPCYRTDIRHEQDLIEDVAIAFGYKNLFPRKISAFTVGSILPAERKKQQVREALVSMGFLEIVSIMLTSEGREFGMLGMPAPAGRVIIDNPISTDQTMVRTGLTTGLLEIIAANASNELPQRLFEVGEVVRVNEGDGSVIEEVLLVTGIADSRAGFSDIKSVLKNFMHETGMPWKLETNTLPFYLPGRSADIIAANATVGHIGEIHPQVLEKYSIPSPVVVMEINLTRMGIMAG